MVVRRPGLKGSPWTRSVVGVSVFKLPYLVTLVSYTFCWAFSNFLKMTKSVPNKRVPFMYQNDILLLTVL